MIFDKNVFSIVIEYVNFTDDEFLIILKMFFENNCVNYFLNKSTQLPNYIKNRMSNSFYIIRNILNNDSINFLSQKFNLQLKENADMDRLKNIITAHFMEHKNENYYIINKQDYLVSYDQKICKKYKKIFLYIDDFTNIDLYKFLLYKNVILFGPIKNIKDNCLQQTFIKTIDLSGLTNLKSIGHNFMKSSFILKYLKIIGLNGLEIIGDNFLNSSLELEEVQINNCKEIKHIGNDFLSQCFGLNKIQINSCNKIIEINNNFLNYCINLRELQLTNCENLYQIKDNFLYNCKKIKKLEISRCKKLNNIGLNFISNYEFFSKLEMNPFLIRCNQLINSKKRKGCNKVFLPRKRQIIRNNI